MGVSLGVRVRVGVSVGAEVRFDVVTIFITFLPLQFWCFKHGKGPEVFVRK